MGITFQMRKKSSAGKMRSSGKSRASSKSRRTRRPKGGRVGVWVPAWALESAIAYLKKEKRGNGKGAWIFPRASLD